ncbi:MAG: HPr family phosphocarrier protein [Saccharofermentanales bacterium]|jgi:phosphotransferase system HPr (HPr) family protein|nr:HPr family phosphocarrier protein [Clostridiaceae bacterium]
MVSKTVRFNCDEALHMKAVAVLIQKASTFRSDLWLSSGDRRANAKSLLGVMSLGIENDIELLVSADGVDEDEALDAIVGYLMHPEV